jgi:hypothetical protein
MHVCSKAHLSKPLLAAFIFSRHIAAASALQVLLCRLPMLQQKILFTMYKRLLCMHFLAAFPL